MANFTYKDLIPWIDEIEQLTDDAEKFDRLEDVFIATSGLKPMYQAQIVKELMRDTLKTVHKLTKPQLQKAIQDAGKSETDGDLSDYFTQHGFNARAMRDKILEDFPPIWTLHDILRIYNEKTGIYDADEYGRIEKVIRSELSDLQRSHSVKETLDRM